MFGQGWREVVRIDHATASRVHQIELAQLFIHNFGDNWVLPELVNHLRKPSGEVGGSGRRSQFEFEYFLSKGLAKQQC